MNKLDAMGSKGVLNTWIVYVLIGHANYCNVWSWAAWMVPAQEHETKDKDSVSLQTVSLAIFQASTALLVPESHFESMCWWLKTKWPKKWVSPNWSSFLKKPPSPWPGHDHPRATTRTRIKVQRVRPGCTSVRLDPDFIKNPVFCPS